jgi:YkoY family integral membrane protein
LFSQTFEPHDLLVIVVLEGVLSIDNALVLGLLARRLPGPLQRKALTCGLGGAFVFRIAAILCATWLLRLRWVKLLGGAYLVYLAIDHLVRGGGGGGDPKKRASQPTASAGFWSTVIAIELTDAAFAVDSILAAVDSILAAVGLVAEGPHHQARPLHPKLWVVVTGGMLGVILIRIAASWFIKLLHHFPRFELAAYLLVLIIGIKLIADWAFQGAGFESPQHPAFWIFWGAMAAAFCIGFLPTRTRLPQG